MAGIYIHIPFCRQACHYCDFHFSTNLSKKQRLIECLCIELINNKDYLAGEEIETIYFGGGSPSLLTGAELSSILTAVNENFQVISSPEITFEGNPDDLTFPYLEAIHQLGINRLSIGIQSFNEETLKFLNRVHSSRQSVECLENALRAGFNNFSIDLMYGIPNRSHFIWESDLEKAMAIKPAHISAYCLTVEEKTAFGNWVKKGKLNLVEDDFSAEQFDILLERLETNGYEHYEISNFSLPGFYSRHNSSYWKQKKYLGVGPGAHSYNGISRRYNIENNVKYINLLTENKLPYQEEILSLENKINEYILTTIRTIWGCDTKYLKENFNYDILNYRKRILEKLVKGQYLIIENATIYLTKKGKLMADKITEELWVEL